MELIYVRTKINGTIDSGYLKNYAAVFDVTKDLEYVTNNFEVEMELPEDPDDLFWSENGVSTILYVEGTEYGGLIDGSVISVSENTIKYTGRTWRGCLSQWVIEPPSGQDYKTVSGNLATIIRGLPKGDYITVADTTYTTGSYNFQRYVTTFEGVAQLLEHVNPSLCTSIAFESSGSSGSAVMSIGLARDLTSLIEVSQDYSDHIALNITRDGNTPRHLICLGQGDLKDRQVIHLYADSDWNVSQTAIAGAYPVETYDFSGSDNLLADGLAHYAELIENHEQIEVEIHDLDVKLADIIAAKDISTGETVTAEIVSIIWRVENYGAYQEESFEYQTKLKLGKKKEAVELTAITTNEIDTILNS